MQLEHLIGIAGAAFILVAGSLLRSAVHRGREVCSQLEARFPDRYEEAGRPRPGYFDSLQRTAYFRFVMRRGFADLGDPRLVREFALLRRSELRNLVFLLAGVLVLGLALLWLRVAPAAPS